MEQCNCWTKVTDFWLKVLCLFSEPNAYCFSNFIILCKYLPVPGKDGMVTAQSELRKRKTQLTAPRTLPEGKERGLGGLGGCTRRDATGLHSCRS